jgi:hypothetical protein
MSFANVAPKLRTLEGGTTSHPVYGPRRNRICRPDPSERHSKSCSYCLARAVIREPATSDPSPLRYRPRLLTSLAIFAGVIHLLRRSRRQDSRGKIANVLNLGVCNRLLSQLKIRGRGGHHRLPI